MRVVSELSCLSVEDKKTLVEEDAVGRLFGNKAVGQEVTRGVPVRQFGDDLLELARVRGGVLGTSP